MTLAESVAILPEDIPPREDPAGESGFIPVARPIASSADAGGEWPAEHGDPMLLGELSRTQCAADLVLFAAYMVGYWYVVGGAFSKPEGAESADYRLVNVLVTLGGGVLSLVVVAIFTRMRGLSAASLGITAKGLPWNLVFGLTTTFATFVVFYAAVQGVRLLWPAGYDELMSNPQRITEHLPRMNLLGFVALALSVGIYEETVFRGFLLTRLRRLTGSWAAGIFLSSVLFTLLHLGMQAPATLVPLFCMALVWCLVTWWRRSLVPVMLGHFLFDFIQLMFISLLNPDWR